MTQPKIPVAIVGATGMVGQRFIQLLEHHPWFHVTHLVASSESAGKRYEEATEWRYETPLPENVRTMVIADPREPLAKKVDFVFSALPGEVARETEERYARDGLLVFSNASAWRSDPDTPLVVTEINADHMALLDAQRVTRGWTGGIVTNPNCTTIQLALALKPLVDAFGVRSVIVSSMQAISGAGYPGVPSFDILDNIVPFIGGEEEKVETETQKILGARGGMRITPLDAVVSASCHRVAVRESHLEDVHVSLGRAASAAEVRKALREFPRLDLPSSPAHPIVVLEDENRPQPRLDRMIGNGMSVVVGRVRADSVLANGIKMEVLGHNTVRGAAGASLLNAEYYASKHLRPSL